MGAGGKKGKKATASRKASPGEAGLARKPKKKCCESRDRCDRCPLRMLKEGTLPAGYTVRKRKLVTLEQVAARTAAKQARKSGTAA